MMTIDIRENFQRVKFQIDTAAKQAGRRPDSIHLVVVTKTHPPELIQKAIDAGARDFGENYIEEAVPKIQHFSQLADIKWHMIGHVQSRKAFSVCEQFHYLHSLDSVKLAERLSRFAIQLNRLLPVFLEFNVSGEETKSGWNIRADENRDRVMPEIEKVLNLPGLLVMGLMTMPPYSPDPETARPYYRKLRTFQEYILDQYHPQGCKELSMGMSGDFEVAIQEGATWVRIGQAIMGPRSDKEGL